MIRHTDQLLARASSAVFEVVSQRPEVAPQLAPVAALLAMIAEDIDTQVSRRVQEAQDITAILRAARELVPPADAERIDRALAVELVRPPDFTLHNVECHVDRLTSALVGVHAWLESPDGRCHVDLLDEVWAVLARDVDHAGRFNPPLW